MRGKERGENREKREKRKDSKNGKVVFQNARGRVAAMENRQYLPSFLRKTQPYSQGQGLQPGRPCFFTAKAVFRARPSHKTAGGKESRQVINDQTARIDDDDIFINTDSGDVTLSLLAASDLQDKMYSIKNIGSNNAIVDPDGTETIDGDLTETLIKHEIITIKSDGSNWWIK